MPDLAPKVESHAAMLERVVLGGDLSALTSAQRLQYYTDVCRSLDLNPLTKPFQYLRLSGRLVLYATKDCTEQLRKKYGVSVDPPVLTELGDAIFVTITARDRDGRTDSDIGVVLKSDMQANIANVMKKAVTQAKRRVTLSLCGLGMLDESEVADVPDAAPAAVDTDTGELLDGPAAPPAPLGDRTVLLGRIEAGFDKLKLKAGERVALSEAICGISDWTQAETHDLERLVVELVRKFKATKT
jgi:hypothetical protein